MSLVWAALTWLDFALDGNGAATSVYKDVCGEVIESYGAVA